jgi:acetylornithine/succinyldiaminopimelate/putrescine aminotransferase
MTVHSGASEAAIAAEHRHGAHNYLPLPVVLAHGEGVWVHDIEGRRYFDALPRTRRRTSGIATRGSCTRPPSSSAG